MKIEAKDNSKIGVNSMVKFASCHLFLRSPTKNTCTFPCDCSFRKELILRRPPQVLHGNRDVDLSSRFHGNLQQFSGQQADITRDASLSVEALTQRTFASQRYFYSFHPLHKKEEINVEWPNEHGRVSWPKWARKESVKAFLGRRAGTYSGTY